MNIGDEGAIRKYCGMMVRPDFSKGQEGAGRDSLHH